MKLRLLICTILLLSSTSCSREDAICECIRASEELSNYSSKVLKGTEKIEDAKIKLDTLRKTRNIKCEDYQTMSGEQMLKKKKTCKSK